MEWDEVRLLKKRMLGDVTSQLDEVQLKLLTYLLTLERERRQTKGKGVAKDLKVLLSSLLPEAD